MFREKSALYALRSRGVRGLGVHVITRLLGDAHFLRPASSIDFRGCGMQAYEDLQGLIMSLLPAKSQDEVSSALLEAENFLQDQASASRGRIEYPDRWNSGEGLKKLLYAVVRLESIELVVETGTANGASALAISGGLHANGFGQLFSFDVNQSSARLVPEFLRDSVHFIQTDGSRQFLEAKLATLKPWEKKSLFLHDADHSYLGQMSDFEVARDSGFSYIFSDDVDASLAFCDFAGPKGKIFYDSPKFIGCYLNGIS